MPFSVPRNLSLLMNSLSRLTLKRYLIIDAKLMQRHVCETEEPGERRRGGEEALGRPSPPSLDAAGESGAEIGEWMAERRKEGHREDREGHVRPRKGND